MIRTMTKVLALALLTVPAAVMAAGPQMTGDEFLQQNETQKEIYLSDLAVADDTVMAECVKDKSTAELAKDLSEWLRSHPEDLSEPAHQSLAEMLLELCPE